VVDEEAIGAKFRMLAGQLDERGLRLWAAAEAESQGRGGTAAVARATGIAPSTIRRGRAELASGSSPGPGRVRRPGAGRKPLTARKIKQVVNLTLNEKPREATHWSERTMAARAGIAPSSVHKIWAAHGLKPHLTKTFKLSRGPNFVAKVEDIVGLYLNPPDKALVLAVDEKSQIQALDRTQPGLPMKKGRCGTMTHDYKRNGTTTLFAALNMLDGTVIGRNMQRHRHQEFIRFLNTIEARVPKRKAIHAIVDNYATHKHPKVRRWLTRHPRWTFHFTPTSASWLNAVEGFFAKLTKRRLKRGVFRSLPELQAAINRFLAETNDDPKPFVWTAEPEKVLAAIKRGKQALESLH